jgi:hypothetical protein
MHNLHPSRQSSVFFAQIERRESRIWTALLNVLTCIKIKPRRSRATNGGIRAVRCRAATRALTIRGTFKETPSLGTGSNGQRECPTRPGGRGGRPRRETNDTISSLIEAESSIARVARSGRAPVFGCRSATAPAVHHGYAGRGRRSFQKPVMEFRVPVVRSLILLSRFRGAALANAMCEARMSIVGVGPGGGRRRACPRADGGWSRAAAGDFRGWPVQVTMKDSQSFGATGGSRASQVRPAAGRALSGMQT